eukprot:CAMPEP_0181316706 /NCGR_PEP_ID=MMETSP1101-20121128/16041_1 /TAXON_ID=46948 /ORGANISM="Rhodomonas abbreviata, Strain Caron Lab Isolate" /LENGTH=203 /DNA_ID=CAMNT_0023423977 /DNA_START=39 /DNA_END=650 /DNA_ORIENTATION=-
MKYSRDLTEEGIDESKTCKTQAHHVRNHYKNSREVGHAIKGMKVGAAVSYLEAVLEFKDAIPFKRHTGGCGRKAMGKQRKVSGSHVGFPVKTCQIYLDLLTNLKANAEAKGLDVDSLVLRHVSTQRAPKTRRRCFRAHGRIAPFMASNAHMSIIAVDEASIVPKAKKTFTANPDRITLAKARTNKRIRVGGGLEASETPAIEA